MRTRHFVLTLAIAAAALPVLAAGPYTKVAEIPVGGAVAFDYLNADGAGKRLYLSHGTEVVVIDTEKNTVVGRIGNLVGVHGIALAPELGKGFITEGRNGNRVAIFDLKTMAVTSKVSIAGTPEANPDAILYEPTQKRVWAFNHSGSSVTIIDAVTGTALATTPLSGVVENGVADASIGKVFINIEDKNVVDVVDMTTFKKVASYPVGPAEEPTGSAMDAAAHHLFVGGGPNLVMMDTRTGKVLSSAKICDGTDATFYDASAKTVFVSCSDGHIAAFAVNGDTLKPTETITTTPRARTMALDAVTHRIYVAGATYLPVDPKTPTARPQAAPDSFRVLVFAPGK